MVFNADNDTPCPGRAAFAPAVLVPEFPLKEETPDTEITWVLVSGTEVAITKGDPLGIFSSGKPGFGGLAGPVEYLGHRGAVPVYAAEIPDGAPLPEGRVLSGVKELYGRVPDEDLAIASFAVRMIAYAKTARFCGRCGHATGPVLTERAKKCPACGLVIYPRISPAILVLITKGDEILLARSPRFPRGMFSLVAGFVEPGETVEHAVAREVREEVGISVKNLRYIASEPWPFPDSLMLAFVAEYAGGEIAIDGNEIEEAGLVLRETTSRSSRRRSAFHGPLLTGGKRKIPAPPGKNRGK